MPTHPQTKTKAVLAIDGGEPARTRPEPPMFPGALEIGDAEIDAAVAVVRSKRLVRFYGPDDTVSESTVDLFEQRFAQRMQVEFALGVSSGTGALITGLAALGIGPGDEVIVPAYTFVASPSAVLAVGAIPVIVEVDESLTLDPDAVAANVNEHTRAIMPVHMRGAPAKLDALTEIAAEHRVALIEDCAQACGASFQGRPVGGFGQVGCFSLQAHKVITTGEGGVLVSNDPELMFRAKCFHDSASEWRGAAWQDPDPAVRATFQGFPGMNFRMGEIAGAIGTVQLGRLDGLLKRMRAYKRRLDAVLDGYASIRRREANDDAGDAGLAAIFYVDSPELAGRVAEALGVEGVGARVLHVDGEHDWHVYS
jgi:8-amino-3,8-dideoxy-alpha-D-manno-octulosonate transaminase